MLDTDTKRRIDTARDILVGKVPDPKSQVEQITIALIYKFMDDMDAESEELGGKRKFFTGDYARYGWAKLMAPSLGGHEMLGLYGEGIAKMPENPGIPPLFRDIFKNAYLPYRDPETLKAFLKIIDEFSYDHSERLGDAFEYLLSVLGSQGDAGQFRTPRHIIDFMVEVLAPQKSETILDKSLARAADTIAFFKVENDGYGLGAQRRAIEKNDLPQVQAELAAYLQALRTKASIDSILALTSTAQIVPKERIAANGDYNLSGERYRDCVVSSTAYPLVPVERFMKEGVKTVDPRTAPDEMFELWSIPAFDAGSPELLRGGEIGSQKKVVSPGDVLLSRIIPHIRRGWVVRENSDGRRQIASTEWIVFSSPEVVPSFLRQLLVSDFFHVSFMQTITGVGGSLSRANPRAVGEIKIPLPPLEVQKELVAEIEGYQKVINGARAVLDHYRPHIPIHPDWPVFELSEVTTKITDGAHFTPTYVESGVPFLRVTDITESNTSKKFIPQEEHDELIKRCRPEKGDVLYSKNGTIGIAKLVDWDWEFSIFVSLCLIKPRKELLDPHYLKCFLNSDTAYAQATARSKSGTVTNLHLVDIKTIKIPLPPLATQQAIVADIEAEQALVAANRELITRFEAKIKAALARVWGEDVTESFGEAA